MPGVTRQELAEPRWAQDGPDSQDSGPGSLFILSTSRPRKDKGLCGCSPLSPLLTILPNVPSTTNTEKEAKERKKNCEGWKISTTEKEHKQRQRRAGCRRGCGNAAGRPNLLYLLNSEALVLCIKEASQANFTCQEISLQNCSQDKPSCGKPEEWDCSMSCAEVRGFPRAMSH